MIVFIFILNAVAVITIIITIIINNNMVIIVNYLLYCLLSFANAGPQGARDGTLTVMIGGPADTVQSCTPVLECYSRKILRFGEVGSGMAAKLINQALVGVHALAASEAIYMAESFGIDSVENISTLKEMLHASWGQSKVLELCLDDYIKAKTLGSNEVLSKTAAPLRNLRKDFSCIERDVTTATNNKDILNKVLHLVGTANKSFDEAKNIGLDDSAFVSLVQLLESKSGIKEGK